MPDVIGATIGDTTADFQLEDGELLKATIAQDGSGFAFVEAETSPDSYNVVWHVTPAGSDAVLAERDTLDVSLALHSAAVPVPCRLTFHLQHAR